MELSSQYAVYEITWSWWFFLISVFLRSFSIPLLTCVQCSHSIHFLCIHKIPTDNIYKIISAVHIRTFVNSNKSKTLYTLWLCSAGTVIVMSFFPALSLQGFPWPFGFVRRWKGKQRLWFKDRDGVHEPPLNTCVFYTLPAQFTLYFWNPVQATNQYDFDAKISLFIMAFF